DHRNRHQSRDPTPIAPTGQLGKIVRPHDPNEASIRIAAHQLLERINGVAGAQLSLDRSRSDWRTARHALGRAEPSGERCHPGGWLERIAGRNEPPELVKIERAEGVAADRA